MRVLAVYRAPQFSPNSVEKDRAIMDVVIGRLRQQGHEVETAPEEELSNQSPISPMGHIRQTDLVLTMGRLPSTLAYLRQLSEETETRVINSPGGVFACARSLLQTVMERVRTPVPPSRGSDGYWLKRGDAAAQTVGDVVFAADERELSAELERFHQRGIHDVVISAHVVGDVVKFYGVRGTEFFRYYYPTDDGQTKFADEQRNGSAHHYTFELSALRREADRLAQAVGVDVYGGDCIIRADGTFCIIDFNDWPSFSRCRDDAAEAIVSLCQKKL